MGTPRSSGLISIVAAAATTLLLTVATGKKAVIQRILWMNRTGGNGFLRIGYVDVVAGAFQQVLPDILMVNLIEGQVSMIAGTLPLCGNSPDGFIADTTPAAGATGTIVAQTSVGAAAPTDVQVIIDVEEM